MILVFYCFKNIFYFSRFFDSIETFLRKTSDKSQPWEALFVIADFFFLGFPIESMSDKILTQKTRVENENENYFLHLDWAGLNSSDCPTQSNLFPLTPNNLQLVDSDMVMKVKSPLVLKAKSDTPTPSTTAYNWEKLLSQIPIPSVLLFKLILLSSYFPIPLSWI